jgi:PAS domain S-box-containing protein
MNQPTILCVIDNQSVLQTLKTQLLQYFPACQVSVAEDGDAALVQVKQLMAAGCEVALVMADCTSLAEGGGSLYGSDFPDRHTSDCHTSHHSLAAWFMELHRCQPQALTVVLAEPAWLDEMTDRPELDCLLNQSHFYRFLSQPWLTIDLQLTVREALRRYQQERRLGQLEDDRSAPLEAARSASLAVNPAMDAFISPATPTTLVTEEQDRLLSEISPVGIFRNDLQGHCTYANARTLELTGLALAENLGEGWGKHLHPDDRDRVYAAWSHFVEQTNQGQTAEYRIELRFLYPDGAIKWVIAQAVPEYHRSGQLVGFIGSVIDITELKQIELALQQTLEFNQQIVATVTEGIIVWDRHLRYQVWNQFMEELSGVAQAMVVGKHPLDLFPFLQENGTYELLQRALAGETVTSEDVPFAVPATNRSGWTVEKFSPLRNPQGEIMGVLGLVTDITHRKRTELELLEKQDFIQRIANTSAGTIYLYDVHEQRNLYTNRDFLELLGYSTAEVQSMGADWLLEILHPDDLESVFCHQSRIKAAQDGEVVLLEYRVRRRDGQWFWAQSFDTPFKRDEFGQVRQYLGTVFDITDRKQAELALQQLNAELEERVQTRTYELQQQTQLLETILNSMGDGVLVSDTAGNIFRHNPAAEQITGLGIPGAELETWSEFWGICLPDGVTPCPPDRLPLVLAMRGESADQLEVVLRNALHPEGIYVEATVRPFYDADGHLIGGIAVFRDITERKQAEVALQQKEEQYRTIFEAVSDSIFINDLETGQLVEVNPAAYQMHGYSREEMLKLPPTTYVHPDFINVFNDYIQTLKRGKPFSGHAAGVRKDGTFFDIEVVGTPFLFNNKPHGLGLVRDISDRKRAEDSLKQSEQDLRTIFNNVYDCIFIHELDGTILDVNDRALELNRVSREQMLAATIGDLSPPDAPLEQLPAIFERVKAGEAVRFEWICQRLGDGSRFISEVALRMVTLAKRSVYIAAVRDISDRKQAESALQEAQRFAQSIADNTPNIIYIYDLETYQNVYTNRELPKLMGYSAEAAQAMGSTFLEQTIHPDDFAYFSDLFQRLRMAADGEIVEMEYRMRGADGSWHWLYDRMSVFKRNAQGRVIQHIGAVQDISDRKQVEEELRQLNAELETRVEQRTLELQATAEAAEAANRAKTTFLSNISHELRTPLNAILGFSQLLSRDHDLNADQQEKVNIINRSGEHLLNLINDILAMSKIEAGRVTLTLKSFDLQSLLSNLEELFRLKAESKGLTLTIAVEASTPRYIETDEGKLRQVLINLLSNAIKFTAQGGITLQVWRGETMITPPTTRLNQDDSNPLHPVTLHFEVRDTGIGIEPTEQLTVFEPFVQTRSGQMSQEGTGLGLPISHQFVKLMGGELSFTSVPDQGTTFYFTIPVGSVRVADLLPQVPTRRVIGLVPDQPDYRLLVVEDNPENRQFLLQLLCSIGFDVQSATNGEEAIDQWQSWQPHLIWMDMRMPTMDGYIATKRIRELEQEKFGSNTSNETANDRDMNCEHSLAGITPESQRSSLLSVQTTKIIALTASAFEDERPAILAAGCDDFVFKPATESLLFEKMSEHLGVRYLYQEPSSREPVVKSGVLTVESLRVMPPDWIRQLQMAARIADEDLILDLLDQIPDAQNWLVTALQELVNELQLDRLIELTRLEG